MLRDGQTNRPDRITSRLIVVGKSHRPRHIMNNHTIFVASASNARFQGVVPTAESRVTSTMVMCVFSGMRYIDVQNVE